MLSRKRQQHCMCLQLWLCWPWGLLQLWNWRLGGRFREKGSQESLGIPEPPVSHQCRTSVQRPWPIQALHWLVNSTWALVVRQVRHPGFLQTSFWRIREFIWLRSSVLTCTAPSPPRDRSWADAEGNQILIDLRLSKHCTRHVSSEPHHIVIFSLESFLRPIHGVHVRRCKHWGSCPQRKASFSPPSLYTGSPKPWISKPTAALKSRTWISFQQFKSSPGSFLPESSSPSVLDS